MRITKTIIQLVILTGCLSAVQAQKTDNIEAKFTGGNIQVSCSLQTTSRVDLFLYWSDDGGLTFNPCLTVTGNLTNQLSGRKTIVWDCIKDGIFMGDFIFKITCIPSNQPPPRTMERPTRTTDVTPTRDTKNEMQVSKTSSNKTRFLIMAGIATGPALSGTLTAGILPGKWGGYAKVKSNFATKGDAQTGGPDDAFYLENFSQKGRFTVSAGVTGELANMLLIYAGIGYGSKWVQWKTTSDQLITIDEMTYNGIDPELGLTLKAGNFLIGAGVSVLFGTQTSLEANLSLGLIF